LLYLSGMGVLDNIPNTLREYRDGIRRCWTIDVQRTTESFADTWKMAKAGNPSQFAIKATGVGLGCALTGAGVYQLIQAPGDKVVDSAKPEKTHMNYLRVFVGGTAAFLGALGAYVAATAGVRGVRV
jgi:hypothetical protein